nr:hypothetical protein [Ardenticatenales bacterium]
MPHSNNYIPISKEVLEQLYLVEGLSQSKIGQCLGVSAKTISNRLAEYGIETRRTEYIEIARETLEELYYEQRMTQKEIGAYLGVSEVTVRKRMAELNLETRGNVEIPREELERLYYEEGWTQEQIAQEFGVAITTISYRMAKYGMEARHVGKYRVEIPREALEKLYYEAGLTHAQIGEKFGVSGATIRNRMIEFGMESRGHWDYVYIDIPKEELYRLYVELEMSAPAIAEIYGCAASVVYRRMQEHGIEVRPNGWDKVKQIIPSKQLEWSPEFAYVIGLLASDGNLRRDANEVKFYSTDRELADSYCRLLGLRPDDISPDEWGVPDAVQVHVYHDTRLEQYKHQY